MAMTLGDLGNALFKELSQIVNGGDAPPVPHDSARLRATPIPLGLGRTLLLCRGDPSVGVSLSRDAQQSQEDLL
jgi:hypothetical protein